MIELRTYRDGGQSAADVAREVAEFVDAAEHTLELALYDIRLHDEPAEIVSQALVDAHERGVAVRLAYNVNHSGPVPVPAAAAVGSRSCSSGCRSGRAGSRACPT